MTANVKDKHKERRRPMRYTAWIAIKPGTFHGCVVSDISDGGARIDLDTSEDIPDRFPLFLSRNGRARRVCTVVWRKPQQLGVVFTARGGGEHGAAPAPANAGEIASPPLAPAEADAAPASSEKTED